MKLILPRFQLEAPESLKRAAALLAGARDEARLLAGGTDLLVKMKRGELSPRLVVSLGRVPGLDKVEPLPEAGGTEAQEGGGAEGAGKGAGPGDGIRLGALATMTRLAQSTVLSGAFAGIAEGAAAVGGPIVRNRATVGGNIVNARPCADTVPPLLACGARLRLASGEGGRLVDLDGFITGPGQTGIRSDEILTHIELPPAGGHAGSAYIKITRRAAMEVTLVGCAAGLVLDPDGQTIVQARLVLASVAPLPLRVVAAEQLLSGQPAGPELFEAAAEAAQRAARPIDDHRAPAFYRSEMVRVTTRRALLRALQRARQGAGKGAES